MMNNIREKLIDLLIKVDCDTAGIICEKDEEFGIIADHLIANGVIVMTDSQGCEYCDDPHPARDCVLDDGTEQMLVCYPDGTIWGKPFIHTRKINFCPRCGRNLFTPMEGEREDEA